ncbi:hypothetical protein CSC12_0738 [Klebsiella michiganensis]|nr:hypothetical protein CSC12_0738 [Klebsiella michiganensis]
MLVSLARFFLRTWRSPLRRAGTARDSGERFFYATPVPPSEHQT